MCGIAGKINLDGHPVSLREIKRMTDAIAHRGPDDEGQWVEDNVGLGNRRLAIIDLSPAGHMPMIYLNRYVITYNGEIYNFQPERDKLRSLGFKFRSNSDTEIILALYDKYKTKCVDHLRGMFAFAIWDRKEKILFAARDRLGKKPFKYYIDKKKFIFASELKAIDIPRKLDYEAMWDYLTYQYVPFPKTGFLGISKLPPAHYLMLKNNKLVIKKYWDLDYTHKENLSEEEWQEKVLAKLDESVKLRLISDVPLGVFLSGGTDSSAVVASMALQSKDPVKTFSISFNEPAYDETKYARLVADRYHTDHTEFTVDVQNINILPDLVRLYEEPYGDSSALATYYVSKLTRQHVTVALNGDGGDENFAGYGWYQAINYSKYFNSSMFTHPAKLLNNIFDNTFTYRGLKFAESLSEPLWYRYVRYLEYFSDEQKSQLISNFKFQISNSRLYQGEFFRDAPAAEVVNRALYSDIHTYLPGDLLVKVDLASMGNSLEGRSPLLDHEFMEMTAKIPASLKIKNGEKKYVFKKALESRLPKELLYRRKMGFGIPLDIWFRNQLSGYLDDQLLSGPLIKSGLFNKPAITNLIRSHQTTGVNHSYRLWALLTLSLWLDVYKPEL